MDILIWLETALVMADLQYKMSQKVEEEAIWGSKNDMIITRHAWQNDKSDLNVSAENDCVTGIWILMYRMQKVCQLNIIEIQHWIIKASK